ncbi:GM14304 [Drosophila sechellia]|uniref:GM14304 n=1 Tax=Drosophila sechellia TaxID=7238 RepID=B4HV87_DROSE|nr:GM14304 [Drosophila sechellia]
MSSSNIKELETPATPVREWAVVDEVFQMHHDMTHTRQVFGHQRSTPIRRTGAPRRREPQESSQVLKEEASLGLGENSSMMQDRGEIYNLRTSFAAYSRQKDGSIESLRSISCHYRLRENSSMMQN